MSTIQLKSRCSKCNGTGAYSNSFEAVPCWNCEGKGYYSETMRLPDPRWRREFLKAQKEREKQRAKG